MTLNPAALYLFAIATITMLGLFARHNRKIGWVKQRKTFVSDLLALQSAWDEIDQAVAGHARITEMQPIPLVANAGFSLDLAKMQNAVGYTTVQPETHSVTQAKAKTAEKVLV